MDDEVFSQHRETYSGANLPQVVGRAGEVIPFGEHRNRCRSPGLIGSSLTSGIQPCIQNAAGGRAAFDRCDYRHARTRQGIGERAPSRSHRRLVLIHTSDDLREPLFNGCHDVGKHSAYIVESAGDSTGNVTWNRVPGRSCSDEASIVPPIAVTT